MFNGEMNELIVGACEYICGAFEKIRPTLVGIWIIICYVVFPDKAYLPAAFGLCGAIVMDTLTKYYAIAKQNGGLRAAFKSNAISSRAFWEGTKKKLMSCSVIMILCGLSIRVAPIAGVAVFLSSIAYSYMFFRECQSCAENLRDAGIDSLDWFINLMKKKQTEIIEEKAETSTVAKTVSTEGRTI